MVHKVRVGKNLREKITLLKFGNLELCYWKKFKGRPYVKEIKFRLEDKPPKQKEVNNKNGN